MFGRGNGDAKRGGRLVKTHPNEITQLHQFGLPRINRGEFFECFVYGEELIVVRRWRRDFDIIQINAFGASPSFCSHSPPRAIDQYAAHRFCRRAKVVRAILKGGTIAPAEPHPRFMDKSCRLEGLAGGFMAHFGRSNTTQFIINKWKQILRGLRIALLDPAQNLRDFGHSLNVRKKSSKSDKSCLELDSKTSRNSNSLSLDEAELSAPKCQQKRQQTS